MSQANDQHEITVRDGVDALEDRQCRIMRMPDGRNGALWRGLVYPLLDDRIIDVAGEAVPPSVCNAPQSRSGPAPSVAVVDGIEESWLLMAGSAADQTAMAGRLREAGVEVLRQHAKTTASSL